MKRSSSYYRRHKVTTIHLRRKAGLLLEDLKRGLILEKFRGAQLGDRGPIKKDRYLRS